MGILWRWGVLVVVFVAALGALSGVAVARRTTKAIEASGQAVDCPIEKGVAAGSAGKTKRICSRVPKKVLPWSLRSGPRGPLRLSGGSEMFTQSLSNEAGDELEVALALPSTPFEAPFNKKCELTIPYVLSEFNPCGYVTFYDAKWGTAEKAPITNKELDAEYDACGELVESGLTEGWHVIGTEYTLTGWHAGHAAWVPGTVENSCLGTWTLSYAWIQKFSDGETLTAEVEVPFLVTPVPISASETWGGGNPSEQSCTQVCHGDPVNTATGDFYESTTDLSIPGRGPGLGMDRTYSSLAARSGVSSSLGRGWTFAYDMSLSIDSKSGDATVINSNGSRTPFEASAEGFEAAPHILATLVENEDGTFTYTVKERTIYTFDSTGRLIAIANLNGDETVLTYDEAGRLEAVEDEAGRTLTFSFDEESGRLVEVADSTGRAVGYDYDEAGDLEKVTDVRGGHTEFTYDKGGLLLTRKDPRGNVVVSNTYDEAGRVEMQTDGTEDTTEFFYGGTEPFTITWVEDPRGFLTRYDYKNGALVEKRESSTTSEKAVWTYKRDPLTLGITAVTDPLGHTSHATYDARGNQTSTEDALGNTTESVYDSFDDLTEYTDAEGVTTTYEYDADGNLLSASTPLVGSEPPKSRTTTYSHEDEEHPGDITAATDPNGKTTHFTYDAAGNLKSTTDALGNKTTYTYDARGNQLTRVSPRGNPEEGEPAKYTTTFTYDKAGNRLTATDPLGHERSWAYDPDGNLESETNTGGHTTSYGYDASNRLIEVEKPDGQTEMTTYDEDGNVAERTDGLEHKTTYEYDTLDRLETKTDPLGRTTEYRHDRAGNLGMIREPEFQVTFFQYDEADELTNVFYGDETTPNVEYGYDPNGRKVSMSDGTGESTYEYDSLGRLRGVTDGHGDATSYDYDLAGNLTKIGYPNGKSVTRAYDDAGRLEQVSDWLGNTTSFAYDPDSDLEATTFPEGTGEVDSYSYDRAGRMDGVEMKQGPEALASLGYSRDNLGRVEAMTSGGLPGAGPEAFEYDEGNHLLQAGSEAFEYDGAGHLTEAPGTTNTYDAAGQLKSGAGLAYHYDGRGRRTAAGAPTAEYVASFGSSGSENGQFQHPSGIAVDAGGHVWVADEENSRIEEFGAAGEYLGQFGSEGSEPGQLEEPTDIAIDSEGHLWVTDTGNGRIQEFNAEGEYLSSFGPAESEEEEATLSYRAESLAIDSGDHIWVADSGNRQVREFSREGKLIKAFGEYGSEKGQIIEANAIAIGPEDEVWLVDYSNFRVDEFSPEGELIREVGSLGSGNGQFEGPSAIDVDGEGNVWVADEWNPRVQKFGPQGEYLGQFGERGTGEGQFEFGWHVGLAVDQNGNVWVSDTENARVQRWQIAEGGESAPTAYEYDQAGNLIAVDRPASGESAAVEESYTYDGAGLRAAETVSGSTRQLTWDQSGELPLLLDDGYAYYVYGPDGLPIEQIVEGTATYYHHDQLGSTRMLTDASGEPTATFTYSAYGTPTGHTGTQKTPFSYAGQYTNAGSGLQYLRARVYDPATGQFLTKDPLEALTRSTYGYAAGNPVNATDPSGLWLGLPIPSPGEFLNSLNPIKYYEEEIEAIENGCSYWEAVSHGLEGAVVGAGDLLGLSGLARLAAEEGGIAVERMLADLAPGRNPGVYLVDSDAQLQEIFDQFAARGTPIRWQGYNGEVVELPDGTKVGLRYDSKSGGKTIDIRQGATESTIHIAP